MSAEDELFEEEDNSLNQPPPPVAAPRRPRNPFRDNAVTLVVLGLLIIVFFYLNNRNEQVFHPRTNSDFLFNANPTPIKKEANFETMPAVVDPAVPQRAVPLAEEEEPIRKISSSPSVSKLSKLKEDIYKLQKELTQDEGVEKKKEAVGQAGKESANRNPAIVVNDIEKERDEGRKGLPKKEVEEVRIEDQIKVVKSDEIQVVKPDEIKVVKPEQIKVAKPEEVKVLKKEEQIKVVMLDQAKSIKSEQTKVKLPEETHQKQVTDQQIAVKTATTTETAPKSASTPPQKAQTAAIPKPKLTLQEYNSKIYSGEIHYSRIPVEYWEHRILMIKALGLNTLSVYVMWNYHEIKKGEFDYQTENKNLTKFLDLAVKHKMKVLIRPGPYVCGEWDFGGLPARLLGIESLVIRSPNELYLKQVKLYFQSLAPILRPYLIKNGGPIVMLQIQNELGSYSSDKQYTQALVAMWEELEIKCQFYIEDAAENVEKNYWNGAAVGLSGGNQEFQYRMVKKLKGNGSEPFVFGGEIYSGWMTHWGEDWGGSTFQRFQEQMTFLITTGKEFSLYVAYGGTNFGLTAGANAGLHGLDYQPAITSYDYDAVITEQGRTTKKYEKMREWMAKYIINPSINVPEPIETMQIPSMKPQLIASLLEHKGSAFLNDSTELYFFQHDKIKMYDQGIVVYQTYLTKGIYTIQAVIHDFAVLFQDGQFIASFARIQVDMFEFIINCASEKCEIMIMVEAMGHNNYGTNQGDDIKGMLGCEIVNGTTKLKWNLYKIQIDSRILVMDRVSEKKTRGASVFKAVVELSETKDTHIDVRNYQKGYVWVNGRNLGRYWNRGPQYRLYCPGVWLKKGKNQIIILDLLEREPQQLRGTHNLTDPQSVEPPKPAPLLIDLVEAKIQPDLVLAQSQVSIPYPVN